MTYPHEQALLPEQVATRLQICRESVLRMLRSGELRGFTGVEAEGNDVEIPAGAFVDIK